MRGARLRPYQMIVVLAALSVAVVGCSDDKDPPPPASAGSTGGAGQAAGGAVEEINVCTLLKADEVTPVIGPNPGGEKEGERRCAWENPETSKSITLSIGAKGTAANGQLPAQSDYGDTEPGPDGIRFGQGNVAEFVVEDRACEIQVVTSVTDNSDRDTAVKLIGLIRGRV